uniref:Uncharacterized protein n=1 Tax=Neobodo designis TaxID=312471 RepID=A0A6U4Y0B0_NEODS|mmetsp:Transcript_6056/g.19131  ORF Transcript_6056/g.19131 Transcript_6056/m.19131 type:complete len:354 (+) Transcript_6056:28-1089(+)
MPGKERATVAAKTDTSPIAVPAGGPGFFQRMISKLGFGSKSASTTSMALSSAPASPKRSPLAPATTVAPSVLAPVDDSLRRDFAFPADNVNVLLFSRHPRWCHARFGLRPGDVLVRRSGALKGTFVAVIGERGGRVWVVELAVASDIALEFDGVAGDDAAPSPTNDALRIDPECPTAAPLEGSNFAEICDREHMLLVPGRQFDVPGSRVLLTDAAVAGSADEDEGPTFGLAPMAPTPEPSAHAGRGDGDVGAKTELHVSSAHLRFLQTAPDLVVELDVPYIPRRQSHEDVDPHEVPAGTETRTVHLPPALLAHSHNVAWAGDGVVADAGGTVSLAVTAAGIPGDAADTVLAAA